MRTDFSPLEDRAAFLEEWRRLYKQSDARFFLSPAWIETLLDCAENRQFGCVRVYDDLRGLYAIGLVSAPPRTLLPILRDARLHETGVDALDRVYLEYNDILIVRNAPAGARDAAVAALMEASPAADQFLFRNATPELTAAVERAASGREFSVEFLNRQPTFAIDMKKLGADSVISTFSSSLRLKIRRSIRRYEERGPVGVHRPSDQAGKAVAWTELMRLHTETWSRRGRRGVFSENQFRQFHEKLLERHADKVDFVRLTAGSETIGILHNFVEPDRVYNYQSGFRYESDNQLAPGFVCHALAADEYRAAGFAVYDMMGGEADYKRRLGREGEALATIAVTKRNLRARVQSAMKLTKNVHTAKMRQT
jgi:CelD/BcsL family acetyltransferase involved in cellulose biosynthesis